jgi:hypothetical protein
MRHAAVAACIAAALAASCDGSKQEVKPLPPAVSLGPPSGGAPAGQPSGMPPGHPPLSNPQGDDAKQAPAAPPPGVLSLDRFKAPEGWQTAPLSSAMKIAQFRLPRADGDAKDGQVDVYGNRMGDTDANIARWRGQFTEVAKDRDGLETITEGLRGKITLLDITGKFSGGMTPGAGGAPAAAEAEVARMLAAVIDLPDGTGYVKATGPVNTIAKWEKSIRDFILDAAK